VRLTTDQEIIPTHMRRFLRWSQCALFITGILAGICSGRIGAVDESPSLTVSEVSSISEQKMIAKGFGSRSLLCSGDRI
jgi:hypothetical protein